MSVFWRFVAFEAVGWAVAFVVAYGAVRFEWLDPVLAWTLFGLFVAKDFVLFPLTKRAYEPGPIHGASELIGSQVRVVETIEPRRDGYVVAGSERWRARLVDARKTPIESGDRARVCRLDGITLIVDAVDATE